MNYEQKFIEIHFGAKDSELKGGEYTIPDGMEAVIEDGKVVVREKESKDERIRCALLRGFNSLLANQPIGTFYGEPIKDILAYLEKQKESLHISETCKENADSFTDDDERIRKELWEYFHELELSSDRDFSPSFTIDDILAWLEKQKEQKPAEWSEEDEKDIAYIIQILYDCYAYKKHNLSKTDYDNLVNKLKSFSPQPKQLKESHKEGFQTARHATALAFMKYCDKIRPNGKMCLSNSECEEIEKAFLVGDWEKIERYFHKYSWKPSEEQMEALKETISQDCTVCNADRKWIKPNLESLYEQLKAL